MRKEKLAALGNALLSAQDIIHNIYNGISDEDLESLLEESKNYIAQRGLTEEQEAAITFLIGEAVKMS